MECFYFLSETTSPGCNADHHFGNVIFYLQKISMFIVKTNVLKAHITLNSEDSGEQSGLNP